MREEFEKLEYIAEKLPCIKWSDELECYTDNGLASGIASWVNGAWYAYQEQQKKIDAVLDLVKDAQNGDYGFTCEGGDIDLFAKEIKELLK